MSEFLNEIRAVIATFEHNNDQINIKLPNVIKLLLKVKAGAKKNDIHGWVTIDNKQYLKISIQAPPEDGKANKMIIAYLAKLLNIPKKNITILSGQSSQIKLLSIV